MTLTDTNDRRIGFFLLLLAILVLCWVLYDLWQRGMNLTQSAATRAPGSSLVIPEPIKNPYNIGEIVNAHIFGEKRQQVAAKPKKVEQKKVEKTRLRLRLLGLVSSSKDGMGRALITAENGKLKSYQVGEQIENTDSSVHSIEPGRVLLERDGQLESLEMVRPKLPKEIEEERKRPSAQLTEQSNPARPFDPNAQPGAGQFNDGQFDDGQYDDGQFDNGQFDNGQFDDEVADYEELLELDDESYPPDPMNAQEAGERVTRLPDPMDPNAPQDLGGQDPSFSDNPNPDGNTGGVPSSAPKFPF